MASDVMTVKIDLDQLIARVAEAERNVGQENKRLRGLLEQARILIANVDDGAWGKQPRDWMQAACQWRDEFHKLLP